MTGPAESPLLTFHITSDVGNSATAFPCTACPVVAVLRARRPLASRFSSRSKLARVDPCGIHISATTGTALASFLVSRHCSRVECPGPRDSWDVARYQVSLSRKLRLAGASLNSMLRSRPISRLLPSCRLIEQFMAIQRSQTRRQAYGPIPVHGHGLQSSLWSFVIGPGIDKNCISASASS